MASRRLASALAEDAVISGVALVSYLGTAHHWRVQGPNQVSHPAYCRASRAASSAVAGWGVRGAWAACAAAVDVELNCAQTTRPR